MRKKLTDVVYSFPFQLLVLHLRSNLLLLAIWLVLGFFITGNLGEKFGIRYLFLSPEYLGTVGFWSFFFVGFGFGALVMSWSLSVYLLSAYRFSFLASLARPFTKFAINNMVIPVAFMVLFLYCQIRFGLYYELRGAGEVALDSIGFLMGLATLVGVIVIYFQFTNKDIFSILKPQENKAGPFEKAVAPDQGSHPVIEDIKRNRNQWRVDTYLTENLRPRLVRSVAHYDYSLLLKVFRQNHLNALVVQLFTLIVLVMLGALMEHPVCLIPTGASIFLLTSVIAAIAGAISFWFNRWRMTAIIVLLFLINQLTRFDLFHHKNKAYGMDYEVAPADYNPDSLQVAFSLEDVGKDRAATVEILEKWKARVTENTPAAEHAKPKMIFFCVSGGGLKSAAWTTRVLQRADSLTNGGFLKHTVLISGASGGLIGAAYYRELALRQAQGADINIYDPQHVNDVSKDLLNPIAFTIITNDLFLPWASFEEGGHHYKKDRGYVFERALNINTHFRMNKTIGEYAQPECEAEVPLVFITPSIVNDGRRLVISSQPVRYMMVAPAGFEMPHAVQADAVDFGSMFAAQGAADLRFVTALRMNATYPYVLPNVYLPSEPGIEVLDAGFRDNLGLKSATRFIHVFRNWIKENTSGVVIVIVRAFERDTHIETSKNRGVFETIFNPLEIAFKVMSLQDYEHDSNLGFIYDLIGRDNLEIIRFTYKPGQGLKDSPISFYMTERERKDVMRAIDSPGIQQSMERLKAVLAEKE
ncbi:MAG: patatin-like phospholipase family protein [Saprospiraceae bacterium]|nr:MAG: patatin-like phospholipase family protein [Saprospiraceae bacterium]